MTEFCCPTFAKYVQHHWIVNSTCADSVSAVPKLLDGWYMMARNSDDWYGWGARGYKFLYCPFCKSDVIDYRLYIPVND